MKISLFRLKCPFLFFWGMKMIKNASHHKVYASFCLSNALYDTGHVCMLFDTDTQTERSLKTSHFCNFFMLTDIQYKLLYSLQLVQSKLTHNRLNQWSSQYQLAVTPRTACKEVSKISTEHWLFKGIVNQKCMHTSFCRVTQFVGVDVVDYSE